MHKFLSLSLIVLLLFLFGCKSSTETKEEPINEFNLLIEHLEGAGGDYLNTLAPNIIDAPTLQGDLDSYEVIDIRSAADYNAGHIEGAVNTTLGNIVTYVLENFTKSDQIVVACYSGQSAGHAVLALNLLGYNAKSLKFGMSSWNSTLSASWDNNINSDYASHFTTDATAIPDMDRTYPTLSTGKTTAEEILMERIETMLEGGFKGINASDVLATKEDYYIVNYFSQDDYEGNGACPPGHIQGAYQYTPKASLKTDALLKSLPADQTIVVYCWTGQTSSQVVAYLNILGYTATSLKFGVNGMVYDQLTGSKWTDAAKNDFDLATE
jgi:rhodanese-related sulfurtransferase